MRTLRVRPLAAVTILLSGLLALALAPHPAAANGDPGVGYATFVYGQYNDGPAGNVGDVPIPNCGPVNINGRKNHAKWSVGSSVPNGATIPVGTVIELTATVYSKSPGAIPNDGPDPLFLRLPIEGPVMENGLSVGDFPGGNLHHHGNGWVGPVSAVPGFAHRFDVNSSPKGIAQPGDGAWVRMRAQARATAPGTITLDRLIVSGFDGTPIASNFSCEMSLPFSWKVRALQQPFAGVDFAATDARYPFENFGDANGGEHGIAIDVLANDLDPEAGGGPGDTSQVRVRDWQPLAASGATVSCGTAQQKGTASFAAMSTGPCTYRPVPGFHGVDTFSYLVRSVTGLERFGLVSVTVAPNHAPVVGQPQYVLNELQQLVDVDLSPVIADPDGDPITCSLVTGPPGLTVDADCTFDFDPQVVGPTSFIVRACDTHPLRTAPQHGAATTRLGGYHLGDPDDLSAVSSRRCQDRNVPVNVVAVNTALAIPPIAGLDTDVVDAGYASEGIGPFSLEIDVLANDIDPNGPDPADVDAWTGTLQILDGPSPTEGTATVLGGDSGRVVRFTPADEFSGPVSFTYRVCEDPAVQDPPYFDDPDTPLIDEGLPLCGVGTVAVTVIPNGAPIAGGDEVTTTSIEPVVDLDVSENDADPEGEELSCVAGPLTAAPEGLVASATIDPSCLVTITPVVGAVGTATLGYRVCDDHPLANPGQPATPYGANGESVGDSVSRCSPADITLTIVAPAVDDPGVFELDPAPVCAADAAQTPAGVGIDIDVLANDSDTDLSGQPSPLTVVFAGLPDAPETTTGGGTVTVADDGGFVAYQPAAGFVGTDTFSYTAQDTVGKGCSAEVTVTVTGGSGTGGGDGGPPTGVAGPQPVGQHAGPHTTASVAGGQLPRTGTGLTGLLVVLAAAALLAGAVLVRGSRHGSWSGRRAVGTGR